MLRQVIQGAGRLHYQASSFKLTAKTPSLLRSFSATTSQGIRYVGPNDKVRFFEQPSRASNKRVEIDPDAEVADERKELEAELAKLDTELDEIRKGPFDVDGPFIQSLPEKERIAAIEVIRKFEAEHGKIGEDTSLDDVFDEKLDDMIKEEFEQMAKEEEEIFDPTKRVDLGTSAEEISTVHPSGFDSIDNSNYMWTNRIKRMPKSFGSGINGAKTRFHPFYRVWNRRFVEYYGTYS